MRGGRSKLIVNLPDSDHGWNSTVAPVSESLEAAKENDCGTVPRAWSTCAVTQSSKLVLMESEKRAKGYMRSSMTSATGVGC